MTDDSSKYDIQWRALNYNLIATSRLRSHLCLEAQIHDTHGCAFYLLGSYRQMHYDHSIFRDEGVKFRLD